LKIQPKMDKEKTYKMTVSTHLKYIWISLLFFLITPVICIATCLFGDNNLSLLGSLTIWILLGFLYLPGFILHFNYYKNDKNRFIIIEENSTIIISEDNNDYKFKIQDIDSIINYHSGLSNRTPWNDYNFTVFKFRNGQEFIITCLILDLDLIVDSFPGNLIVKKNVFYSTLKKLRITRTV
jgi:hypothetical protein